MEKKKRYPLYFYFITVLIPFLLLALVEVGLRLGGFGAIPPIFVPVPETDGKYLMMDHNFSKRYLKNAGFNPTTIDDVFLKDKDPETFRIFVLGESSAAGFPFEPVGAFSRFLSFKLKLLYPAKKFEVVNLGIAALNSYAILDILDEMLAQKPDLVLIYAGHNEYYGAFGAASMVALGESPGATRFFRTIGNLRIFQLLSSIFGSDASEPKGTQLMEALAKDKLVPKGSEVFNAGIDQFNENLSEIFGKIRSAGIPVIAGTLASNLLDQPPFYPEFDGAGEVYKKGQQLYSEGKFSEAFTEFEKAKELDELRFRAPVEFNSIIRKTAEKEGVPVVAVDSMLATACSHGVIGKEVMIDHLHPNLFGYKLMADLFLKGMENNGFLKDFQKVTDEDKQENQGTADAGSVADSLLWQQFPFTRLDSTIALYRIAALQGQWPYNRSGKPKSPEEIRKPTDKIDSVALSVSKGKIDWFAAHTEVADYYKGLGQADRLEKEYRVLISQSFFLPKYYDLLANNLLEMGMYDRAKAVLEESYALKPGAFSTKWLGTLALKDENPQKAKDLLSESINYNGDDTQTLYNLTGACLSLKDYSSAKTYINRCLALDPKYPGAAELQKQLQNF
ncbi:MAG: GDSL-type esterase/lipase family protein [Ignavibacteriales bacterium]|nr:MAG: hypothetical protein F9K26_04185 [Ignavibacteriaceae bacterium]MBW7873510.1 hypothetical protein [Ignavibacteria bacterium]MCZ2142201.1 GDSL-type esterase/lipase family protein [Ignavibacteriales bacterium]OQY76978.1 MAG: hypothetical protein B6D45_03200 [Ignavibacteriales bacterium UTCHB3]MBV6444936.1 hypothetical protein [Ignavibacteriaceae bacterium]